MSANGNLPRNLKIGSTLLIITGSIPLITAAVLFVLWLISVQNPSGPYRSARIGPVPYSLDDIRDCKGTDNDGNPLGPEVCVDFVTAQHIELVNVMNSGFAIIILSIFGLRRFQKWSWWALLAMLLWPGLNDSLGVIVAGEAPIPLVGDILGLVGLFIARPAIFKKD